MQRYKSRGGFGEGVIQNPCQHKLKATKAVALSIGFSSFLSLLLEQQLAVAVFVEIATFATTTNPIIFVKVARPHWLVEVTSIYQKEKTLNTR